MQSIKEFNKNFAYILTCIDVLSKYGWARPLKTKSHGETADAFRDMITSSGRKPWRLFSDKGKEFLGYKFQNLLKENQITHILMENPVSKAANVERYNRTLKTRLWKHFSHKDTLQWLNILPKIVKSLNHTVSRVTGVKPVDVNHENKLEIKNRAYPKLTPQKKHKLKVGDLVRISVGRGAFEKGYLPSRSGEVFVIVKTLYKGHIPVYKLDGLDGVDITSIFYENELVRVNAKHDA
jgi:hypothetical protein